MKKALIALAVFASFAATSANASTITLQTGYAGFGAQADGAAYQSAVDAAVAIASPGYGSANIALYDGISNQAVFGGPNTSIAFKSVFDFNVSAAQAGTFTFRAGVDFGGGGSLFIDGVAYQTKTNDMWWAGSYSDPSQYLTTTLNLSAGNHTMALYGVEGCCDGGQQAQFQIGSGNFTTFGNNDGLTSAVPESETYAMMLAGLGLLGFVARRKA